LNFLSSSLAKIKVFNKISLINKPNTSTPLSSDKTKLNNEEIELGEVIRPVNESDSDLTKKQTDHVPKM